MHWKDQLPLLQSVIRTPSCGLVTDVDGTISPIAATPDAAVVTSRVRDLLAALRDVLPLVAVISGRSAQDVYERVGVLGLIYIGNHGLEQWVDGKTVVAAGAAASRPSLEQVIELLAGLPEEGMLVEDKGATLSIHYRLASDPNDFRDRMLPVVQALAHDHGLKLFEGRRIFELRPPIEINKGSAFHQLVESYGLDAALYLGDDITDADAFRAARRLREVGICLAAGIGVEHEGHLPEAVRESADVVAYGVSDTESLLAWLVAARNASTRSSSARSASSS